MKSFTTHIRDNIGLYVLLVFFSILFFFHLDYSTLSSWDEAWYGVIARDMLARGDFLRMHFNSLPFYDHPPAGFWFMALSYKLLGISEFSTRLPSVLFGIGSIALTYSLSLTLFKSKTQALVAATILGTCVWFVLRVRSGNLDSPFVFFYVSTVYSAIRSRGDIRWFVPTMISFALLFMTKTLVGASAIALVLLAISNHLIEIVQERKLINMRYYARGVLCAAIIILPWYVIHWLTYHDFIQHHFIDIGTRNKTFSSYFQLNATQPLFYLHMGIRKWYYLWLGALGIILLRFDFLKKPVAFLLFWNALVLYPFLTTDKTQLWHLIPVYLPIALITAYGWFPYGIKISETLKKNVTAFTFIPSLRIRTIAYFMAFMFVAFLQIKTFIPEVIQPTAYVPDDVAIARMSHDLTQNVFLDDDFLPMAAYYADRVIYPIRELRYYGFIIDDETLVSFFKSNAQNFAVITRKWATGNLDAEKIRYKIIKENDSFVIVTR